MSDRTFYMLRAGIIACVLVAVGVLVRNVIRHTEARDVERAAWAQELRDKGCKRTGYIPRGHLVQEVYTCPDGTTFLGERK